ncbi:MAG: transporter [Burkholderiaceae bacterium]|nr:transporter [Burkholderiaceae bacterium]
MFIAIQSAPKVDVLVNIPVLAYSSPWKALGGRAFGYVALPQAAIGVEKASWIKSLYNPAGFVGLAWDLGGGWGFSDVVGGYAPIHSEVGAVLGGNLWTFNNRAALSYTGNDWNLTAHVIYGSSGHDRSTRIQTQNDYLNLDLTAIKRFGKWEAGVVGYSSADLSTAARNSASGKQRQFALGALAGYNFGPVSIQMYLTRDVSEKNIGADSNRAAVRLIAPL